MTEITITLVSLENGLSESIPIGTNAKVKELMDMATVLLNLRGSFVLAKDGKPVSEHQTLNQAGIKHGDVLSIVPRNVTSNQAQSPAQGMDFSNLLGFGGGSSSNSRPVGNAGGLDFSALLGGGSGGTSSSSTAAAPAFDPVYYDGMDLQEAQAMNPHPEHMVKLLFSKEKLWKELNHFAPAIAEKLHGKSISEAVKIWREELVKGGIRGAVAATSKLQKETEMKKRIAANPQDKEAVEYFKEQENKKLIEIQYREMMQNYPESMGSILMLYIEASVNDTPIQAFVDSGAQSTIMSKHLCEKVGIDHLIDTRFSGMAKGVGTGKIVGRIHIVSLKINGSFFPCTVTVIESMDMGFLLGLDMLKRHTCQIDLENHCLRFKLGEGKYMATPFLHEKDLPAEKGGTKGFDVDKANQEMMELRRKQDDDGMDEE